MLIALYIFLGIAVYIILGSLFVALQAKSDWTLRDSDAYFLGFCVLLWPFMLVFGIASHLCASFIKMTARR